MRETAPESKKSCQTPGHTRTRRIMGAQRRTEKKKEGTEGGLPPPHFRDLVPLPPLLAHLQAPPPVCGGGEERKEWEAHGSTSSGRTPQKPSVKLLEASRSGHRPLGTPVAWREIRLLFAAAATLKI